MAFKWVLILTTYESWDDPPSAKKDGCEASWLDILTARPLIRYTWRISPWPLLERSLQKHRWSLQKGSVLEGKSPNISGKPMADRGWWYILIWPDSILSDQQINWLKCLCLKIGVWWYSSNIPAICNTIEVTCDVNQQGDVYKGPLALDVAPESFALHCCWWKHCDRQQLEAFFQFEVFVIGTFGMFGIMICPPWNSAPENGWLEYNRFLVEWPMFRGQTGCWFQGNVRCVFLFLSFRFAWIFSLVKVYPLSQLEAKCVYLYTLRKTNMTGWKMDRHEWRCISHWGEYPASFFCCQGWKKQMIVLKMVESQISTLYLHKVTWLPPDSLLNSGFSLWNWTDLIRSV